MKLRSFLAAIVIVAAGVTSSAAQQTWAPFGRAALSASSSSARVALPAPGGVVPPTSVICNNGAADAYLQFGLDNTVVASATTSTWLQQGTCRSYNNYPAGSYGYVYVAAITASGTTSLLIETGTGQVAARTGGGGTGTSATVTVGTTTTLAAGAPATVTNSGTSSAAVLNFGIPQGIPGAGGSGGAAVAATNTDLKSLASTASSMVLRQSFAAAGDAPPAYYTSSNSACSLNSGAGDDGSQVPSSDGKCWLLVADGAGADLSQWGCTDTTGGTDCASAIQNAFNWCVATGSQINVKAGTFRFDTPLNFTEKNGCKWKGVSNEAPLFSLRVGANRVLGSRFLGNTNGKEMVDLLGAANISFEDIEFTNQGAPTPSRVGLIIAPSTGMQPGNPGGDNITLRNVSICLQSTATGPGANSIPIYNVNGSGGFRWFNVWVCGDYGFVFTGPNNPLGITPTYGTYYPSLVGADGIHCYGCATLGSQQPQIYIDTAASISFPGLYMVCLTQAGGGCSSTNSTGVVQYPIFVKDSVDIYLQAEVDYFPSVLNTAGNVDRLKMEGLAYNGSTPLLATTPLIGKIGGTAFTNSSIQMQTTGYIPSGSHFMFSTSTATLTSFYNNSFLFNSTTTNKLICFINVATATPIANIRFDGDLGGEVSAGGTYSMLQNGSPAAANQYRFFVNGKIQGTY